MFKTNLVMLALGKPQHLTPEGFQKLLVLLRDNPELVVSLNRKRIILFSLSSTIKIRKEIWPSLEAFAREFDVSLTKVAETQTFHIARTNDKETELLEKLSAALLVLGITQEEEEVAVCTSSTSTGGAKETPAQQVYGMQSQKTGKSSQKGKKKLESEQTTKRNGRRSSGHSKKPKSSESKIPSSAETANSSSSSSEVATRPRRSSKNTKKEPNH